MAKYGVTNITGGGGIGSDEISVTKEYVLDGKTYLGDDTDDEIGTGTMDNNGTTGNQSLNAGGSFTVKKGYHAQDFTVNSNSLVSQTSGTAAATHILSGQTAWVNGTKINGSIPLQNADIAGTDRAWSQGMSNWAGTINLKVRNSHYLNGVNWIQQNIPDYQPWNIKKGVNIGGVVGTFEGYVPTSTDLYLRGNNIAGLGLVSGISWTSNITFESGGIWLQKGHVSLITNSLNVTPFNYLNVELLYQNHSYSWTDKFYGGRLWLALVRHTGTSTPSEGNVLVSQDAGFTSGVLRLPLANLSLTSKFFIMFGLRGHYSDDGDYSNLNAFSNMGGVSGWIYRIWLS